MSVWCSYTQPGFIPTPGWWFLVGQQYPNDSIQAGLNVYNRSNKGIHYYTSPNSSGAPPLTRHANTRLPSNTRYCKHHKYN